MLEERADEPAMPEWASAVVFGSNKDGIIRSCFDYRCLDAITVRDGYHFLRMDEWFDSFGKVKIF